MDRRLMLAHRQSRRQLLRGIAGVGLSVAGLTLVSGCEGRSLPSMPLRGEPSLETKRLRISQLAAICSVPMHLAAAELMRDEGFSDLQYTSC